MKDNKSNFYANFVQLCKDKGVKPSRAGIEAGIPKQTVSNWKSGSRPGDVHIAKLADYFGVPAEYFSEETPTETKASPTAVGDAMKDLMNHLFDSLSEDAKQEVLSGLLEISRRDKAKDR